MLNRVEIYIKRSITILLAIIMITSCFVPTIAYAEEQSVNEEEAKYLATAFVWDVQSCSDNFDKEIFYSDMFTLYDGNLNPSAYVVNFVDKNNEPSGYVVIGATSDYSEIIEFSDEGRSPYEEQYTLVNSAIEEKVYPFYEGNVSPLCIDKKANNFMEMKEGKLQKSKRTKKSTTLKYSVKDRKNKADEVEYMMVASGGGSLEIEEDDFPIKNPFNYESGFKSWKTASVNYYYDVDFKTQYDYPEVKEACGPIAATNLMIYWQHRNPSKYTGLMRGDSSWDKTFNDLRGRMHFFDTTSVVLFSLGVEAFMDTYSTSGATVNWSFPNSNNWNTVLTEIGDNRYPIVLLLQNHIEYGNHYVVAFEYLSYEYADGTYSNYVQICDGRSSTADRYINFTKGFDSGSIYTITVHPN